MRDPLGDHDGATGAFASPWHRHTDYGMMDDG